LANDFTELLDPNLPEHALRQLAEIDGNLLFYLVFGLLAAIVSWINKRKQAAKLEQESLVTGRAFVALDFDLERPAPPQDEVRLVIPTQPGGFLESLEEMDLKVVKDAILKMIETTDGLLSNKDIPKILNNLNMTLTTFNESTLPSFEALMNATTPNIESLGSDLKIQIKKTAERLDGVLEQAQTALANAGALVDDDSGTVYRLKRLLDEWTTTSRSISSFVEFLERHPEALLFGKGK